MSMNQSIPRNGIRRLYYLAIVILLLALAILAVGCAKSDQGGGVDTQSMGDTPIIISGGSFHLDINKKSFKNCSTNPPDSHYVPCPASSSASDKVFWTPGKITSANIFDDNPGTPDTATSIGDVDGNGSITIRGKNLLNPTELGDVVITSVPPTAGKLPIVTVQMDENLKFKPRGSGTRRTNKSFTIYEIRVIDKNGATHIYPGERSLPANSKFTLEIL